MEYDPDMYELQPTELPSNCTHTSSSSSTLVNVQFLYEYKIINWPNFTNCLPNCGLCTSFASDQTYIMYNLLLIGFLLPFVSVCGLVGNSISAYVYSRKCKSLASMNPIVLGIKSTTNMYLCALGCSDNAVIITAIFLFFIDSIRRYSATLSVIYGQLSPFLYPAGMIAQTCSVYYTLLAGIDCFIQVCLSNEIKRLCSNLKCVRYSIGFILLFSFLYNTPHFFEAVLLECWHQQFHSKSIEVCPAPFRFNPTYILIYYKYMYSIFLAVGPLIILIFLNTCIILVTVFRNKQTKKLESINDKDKTVESPDSGDNIALILVVLLFISCNMIALLINVFETKLSQILEWRINYIIDISNLLVVFNSSFNFVIYYNFSAPFRLTFLQYFCKGIKSYSEPAINSSPINVAIVKEDNDGIKDPRFISLTENNKGPQVIQNSARICKKNPALRLKESSYTETKPLIQLIDTSYSSNHHPNNNNNHSSVTIHFKSTKPDEII